MLELETYSKNKYRRALREAVKRLDPIGVEARTRGQMRKRGQFMVKGPNRVWSIDGHDKLSRFGFQIYAAIDAYSRYIVWCYIGHSNRTAVSVNKQYLTTVSSTQIVPKLIRSDKGGETTLLCNSHLSLRRASNSQLPLAKAYSYGTSTKNQRIESWWNLLANAQTDTWRNLFTDFERQGYFDGGSIDIICLQFIYMKMIRTHVQTFVQVHNTHRIRRQRNREHYLPTGQPCQLYHYPPDGVKDYGSVPNPDILTALEQQVTAYDLDQYLTESTQLQCSQLLLAGDFPTEFSFDEKHQEAYIFLRQAVSQYVENGGKNIVILEPPVGAEEWIALQQRYEQEEGGPPVEFRLDLTDDEEEQLFEEDKIFDAHEEEDDEKLSDDVLDDGFILNI